jgi:hypothetical protein
MKSVKLLTNLLLLPLVMGILFSSCSKDDDNKPDDNEPDDTPSDSIVVSSYSPEFPMWGNIITINGQGFGTRKDEIEVFFPGNYTTLDSITKGEVTELSNTQLKVRIPYHTKPSSLNPDIIIPEIGYNNGSSNLLIKIKGETKYTSPVNLNFRFIWYNAVPFMNNGNSIYTIGITTFGYQIIPGEKFRVEGSGFGMTKEEGVLYVNGIVIPVDSIWGGIQKFHLGGGNKFMIASLPSTLGSKSTDQKDYVFTYTRMGQSYSRTVKGNSLPRLSITGNTLPGSVVGGTSITDFTISGKNLYANTVNFKNGSTVIQVATTGASINSTQLSAFVPLGALLPFGDKIWQVTLNDTEVGSTLSGGWTLGSVRIIP